MNLLNARKKLVTLAVASALGGGVMVSAPAQAVNVSQDNLGEVLLFPYYTVNNGFDTIFTVTNTTDKTTMFKIRFREARNSREVRDFNVILSPYDMWTGAVTTGAAGVPVIRTYDQSCTAPVLPASASNPGAREVEFTSIAYDGTDSNPLFAYDNGGKDAARMNEGYFEIIEMAVSSIAEEAITSDNLVEYKTQHVDGVPRDCATVATYFDDAANLTNGATGSGKFATFVPPADVLKGHSMFIDVDTGKSMEATPTHLAHFQDNQTIIFKPGNLAPDLKNGHGFATHPGWVQASNIVGNTSVALMGAPRYVGGAPAAGIVDSVDMISQILTAESVINEFVADGANGTDWVVTFPTKHYYVDYALEIPPFADNFPDNGSSCDAVELKLWNREEKTAIPSSGGFSPAPTGSSTQLCNEVNILTFNGSNVFGGARVNLLSKDTSEVGTSGWARLRLFDTGASNTFAGLPVIGFAATVRNAGGADVNYGSDTEHAYAKRLKIAP